MNYYEHHLGDYDGATAHLSWLEDCAYRRLLSLYYRAEAPIPADIKQACRLVRAATKPERDAVEQVLREFFELQDDGWHNTRCDTDIATFHEMEPEREAKRENAKERQRRARERRASLFEALRGHDIVPDYNTSTKTLETLLSRVTGALPVTAPVTPVTCDDTVTHTHLPPPTSQTQVREEKTKVAAEAPTAPPPAPPLKAKDLQAEGVDPQKAADWLALRKAKRLPLTPTAWADTKAEGLKAGMTPPQTVATAVANNWAGFKAAWLLRDAGGKPAMRTGDVFEGAH